MRYGDAIHVDPSGFHARRRRLGNCYRWVGYVLLASMVGYQGDDRVLAALLVLTILLWLAAWSQTVGALWRTALVAAALAGAVHLGLDLHTGRDHRAIPEARP